MVPGHYLFCCKSWAEVVQHAAQLSFSVAGAAGTLPLEMHQLAFSILQLRNRNRGGYLGGPLADSYQLSHNFESMGLPATSPTHGSTASADASGVPMARMSLKGLPALDVEGARVRASREADEDQLPPIGLYLYC